MGIWDEWSAKIIANPEWEKIRAELCSDPGEPEIVELVFGNGKHAGTLMIGPTKGESAEERRKNELWGSLCWYVNSGPGYCEEAPPEIKKLLRRLDVKV